ncbi:MAG: glycosyltransferase [Ruminiclostridium sp.]|nr:glycosyltransferase [Ruminiclostridium sp.]
MEEPLVSVIIPVYRVGEYLVQCVDSVICQTYTALEIILVDDGSPDGCGAVCDRYAEADSRVRVIHKENGGLSSARNAGLDIMRGEYVYFLDSDDYIAPDLVEAYVRLVRENDADIVQGTWYEFWGSIDREPDRSAPGTEVFTSEEATASILMDSGLGVHAACSFYRAELFSDIRFPEGLLYEDLATTYRVVAKAKKVVLSRDERYYYRLRPDSIMNSPVTEKDMVLLDIVDRVTGDIRKMYTGLEDECLRKQTVTYLKLYSRILYAGYNSFADEQRRIKAFIKEHGKSCLASPRINKTDKMKVRLFRAGKPLFFLAYCVSDKLQLMRKKRA